MKALQDLAFVVFLLWDFAVWRLKEAEFRQGGKERRRRGEFGVEGERFTVLQLTERLSFSSIKRPCDASPTIAQQFHTRVAPSMHHPNSKPPNVSRIGIKRL